MDDLIEETVEAISTNLTKKADWLAQNLVEYEGKTGGDSMMASQIDMMSATVSSFVSTGISAAATVAIGAKIGATLGWLPGAAIGALVGTAVAVVTELFTDDTDKRVDQELVKATEAQIRHMCSTITGSTRVDLNGLV